MYDITEQQSGTLGSFFEKLADEIDLTKTQQEIAIKRYEVIGEWLAAEDSPLNKFNPRIISQGSFRTGTAVKPPNRECEFDVDLTCILEGCLPDIQKALKELVGERLEGHCARYELTLSEHRRCWRIHYKEASGFSFHLDIVPAMPDDYQWILDQKVDERYAKEAIVITDNDDRNTSYVQNTDKWPKSNTEGYSLWFIDASKFNADKIKMFSADVVKALNEAVEDVPVFNVRMPLQRAVQLMKRHRDTLYEDHKDKPVSVLLTTLAARAYLDTMDKLQPQSFYDVFVEIVNRMPNYIENRNGVDWVPNPVNPAENFADKWQHQPEKKVIFMTWLATLRATILQKATLNEGQQQITKMFSNSFGETSVKNALLEIADSMRTTRDAGNLKMASSGLLGSAGVATVAKHTFHGKKS